MSGIVEFLFAKHIEILNFSVTSITSAAEEQLASNFIFKLALELTDFNTMKNTLLCMEVAIKHFSFSDESSLLSCQMNFHLAAPKSLLWCLHDEQKEIQSHRCQQFVHIFQFRPLILPSPMYHYKNEKDKKYL